MLDAVRELAEDLRGNVAGCLGDKEDAHALGTDQPDSGLDGLQERLRCAVEQQVCLVEEEHEFRFVEVTDLGQVCEKIGDQPHEEGRKQLWLLLERGKFEAVDDAAAVSTGTQQIPGVEFGFAEEPVHALRLEGDELAENHAGGCFRQAAELFERVLALIGDQEGDHSPEVCEVEQFQAGLVRVVEHQLQAGLLGLVEIQHPGQEQRTEIGDGRPDGYPHAVAAEREVLHREARRRPGLAYGLCAFEELLCARSGRGQSGEVTLDVGKEHRHPADAQLLGEDLERDGLPGSGCPRDEAMTVHHGQRQAHGSLGMDGAAHHRGSQLDGRFLEGVPGRDQGNVIGRCCLSVCCVFARHSHQRTTRSPSACCRVATS